MQPFVTDYDVHLLSEGRHLRSYEKLGAHLVEVDGVAGVHFAVWAPNARSVSLIGDFNSWNPDQTPMAQRPDGGVWEAMSEANRYFAGQEPWTLRKTDPARMEAVLYTTAEVLRAVGILVQPFIPNAAAQDKPADKPARRPLQS